MSQNIEIPSIYQAKAKLSSLVDMALSGQRVLIGKSGNLLVELKPIVKQKPKPRRPGGKWEGKVHVSSDFDQCGSEINQLFGLE